MPKKTLRVFLKLFLVFSVFFTLSLETFAFIAWKGVVIDKETGEPIEGAVVVRSWNKLTKRIEVTTRMIAFCLQAGV